MSKIGSHIKENNVKLDNFITNSININNLLIKINNALIYFHIILYLIFFLKIWEPWWLGS